MRLKGAPAAAGTLRVINNGHAFPRWRRGGRAVHDCLVQPGSQAA